ncbi:hypothetical protein IV203_027835 [Nitzschia inconspicua]|uniref:Uncharacterized protein n=1 Tax=Nitzschia inconspicua TaxID=303405 RepID=A0A9K3LXR4_9STRA|nr:hypothetical protein IV203_027835 [Nitzschia inconspicua]
MLWFSALDTAFPELSDLTFVGSLLQDVNTKPMVPGWHHIGVVQDVGSDVDDLKPGEHVDGHLQYSPSTRQRSFAEHIKVAKRNRARVREGVALEVVADSSFEADGTSGNGR